MERSLHDRERAGDDADRVQAERQDVAAAPGETDHRGGDSATASRSRTLLQGGHAPRRQLPRLRGRDQGRARARAVLLPRSDAGHGSDERQRRAPCMRRRWCSSCCCRTCRSASTSPTPSSRTGGDSSASASRASPRAQQPAPDLSHPAMAVNLDACIQCTRCVRACREEQVNDVIGYAFRGAHSKIVFDLDDPMGDVDVRRLRRMRAGLPDRRADAGEATRTSRRSTRRWTRCARSAASAASSPTT